MSIDDVFDDLQKKLNKESNFDEDLMEEYIEENEEKLFNEYCDIFPENINSDTMAEDVDLKEFVETYEMDDFEEWVESLKKR